MVPPAHAQEYMCHDEPYPAGEYTPPPSRRHPPPRLRTLPSDKQIITPRYEAECTLIVHLVHNLRVHLRANSCCHRPLPPSSCCYCLHRAAAVACRRRRMLPTSWTPLPYAVISRRHRMLPLQAAAIKDDFGGSVLQGSLEDASHGNARESSKAASHRGARRCAGVSGC